MKRPRAVWGNPGTLSPENSNQGKFRTAFEKGVCAVLPERCRTSRSRFLSSLEAFKKRDTPFGVSPLVLDREIGGIL